MPGQHSGIGSQEVPARYGAGLVNLLLPAMSTYPNYR